MINVKIGIKSQLDDTKKYLKEENEKYNKINQS